MKFNKRTIIGTLALVFCFINVYMLYISKGVIWGYKDYNYFLEAVEQNEVSQVEYNLEQPKSGDNLILHAIRKDGSSFQVMTPYKNDREIRPLMEKNHISVIKTLASNKHWMTNQFILLTATLIIYIAPVIITIIFFIGLILLFMINSKLKKIDQKLSEVGTKDDEI